MAENLPQNQPEAPKREKSTPALLLTMADTTWRMFVPTAIFVWGGIYGDLKWHTTPWLTFLSVALGLAVSIALIRQQLRSNG